jgi:hypothetical protein
MAKNELLAIVLQFNIMLLLPLLLARASGGQTFVR